MKQVVLGDSGQKVSEICLGTMHLGSNTPDEMSLHILDAFEERGGTFIDTANIYNRDAPRCRGGESETLIGRWIKKRRNKEHLFIATKVGMVYPDQRAGLGRDQIMAECEKSLHRLGVDAIDLYYAHADDLETPMEETLEAFDKLVRQGKVRFIGASNFYPTRLVEARWISQIHGWTRYCCIQQRYSYLRPKPGASFGLQKPANDDLLEYCKREDFPLIGYAPLLKGSVAGRADKPMNRQYQGEDSVARLAQLKKVADALGISMAQLCLAWMRQHDFTVIPLIGVSNLGQLRDNLGAVDLALDPEIMATLF